MAKYVLVYTGGSMPEDADAKQKGMEAWGAWYGSMGDSVTDMGNPFGPSKVVTGEDVSDNAPSHLTGYTIVKADSLEAAAEMAKGCPVVKDGGSVEVYETFDMA